MHQFFFMMPSNPSDDQTYADLPDNLTAVLGLEEAKELGAADENQ